MTLSHQIQSLIAMSVLFELIAAIAGAVVLYYVVRMAVRDGMNDSRLAQRLTSLSRPRPEQPALDVDSLPDMRAER